MLVPQVRARLRATDFRRLDIGLNRADAATEERLRRRLDRQGLDAVLQDAQWDPDWLLSDQLADQPSLEFWTYASLAHVFARQGVTAPEISDYLASVLIHQANSLMDDTDTAWAVQVLSAHTGDDLQRIGNRCLWWHSCVATGHARPRRADPPPAYFDQLVSLAYLRAADTSSSRHAGIQTLLRYLGQHTPLLREALSTWATQHWHRRGQPTGNLVQDLLNSLD